MCSSRIKFWLLWLWGGWVLALRKVEFRMKIPLFMWKQFYFSFIISLLFVVKYKFWFDFQAAMQFGWCYYTSWKLIRFFEQLKFNLKILGEHWTQSSQDKLQSPRILPRVQIRLEPQNFNFHSPSLRPLTINHKLIQLILKSLFLPIKYYPLNQKYLFDLQVL